MSFEIFAINAREALAAISSLKLPSFRKKSRKIFQISELHAKNKVTFGDDMNVSDNDD